MLRNYLKIAFRNIIRHKVYSFINIAGLAIGITCCLLLLLYLQYELSYDRFHEDSANTYRILTRNTFAFMEGEYLNYAPVPLAAAMKETFPEVTETTRFSEQITFLRYQEQTIDNFRTIWADSSFPDIFSFPVYQGDMRSTLAKPYSMALTRSTAARIFGTQDAVGKILRFGTIFDIEVNAILENIPENSHLQFDGIISLATRKAYWKEDGPGGGMIMSKGGTSFEWGCLAGDTYVRMKPGVDPVAFEAQLNRWLEGKYEPGQAFTLKVQPLTDIHLAGNVALKLGPGGNINYVHFLSAITLLILCIACFNYMNLATARSSTRSREIGMRKILGGTRFALIRQFLGESLLLTAMAVAAAVGLTELALPSFNALVGLEVTLDWMHNTVLQVGLIGIIAVVGLLAGLYPALFLSSFRPQNSIRGMITVNPASSSFFRNALVVAQNVISISLIVCTVVIYQQLAFVKNRDLGLSTHNIVTIPIKDFRPLKSIESLVENIGRHPGVAEVACSEAFPFRGFGGASRCWWEGKAETDPSPFLNTNDVSYSFLDFYQIPLVEGRNFSPEFPADAKNAYLLNETAVRAFGWTTAVGKQFGISPKDQGLIIGVVKDFHYSSLRNEIEPLAISLAPRSVARGLSVRLTGKDMAETLADIKSIWKDYSIFPFDYSFLDDIIADNYKSDYRLVKIFTYASAFAVFVACLGMFGLVSFGVERRTREIAVRKVLGASVSGIVTVLSRDFVKWVLAANLIAWPLAWYAMERWLQNYAYRIHLDIVTFVLSGLMAFGIAVITAGFQSARAAAANPVDSLKYE